MTYQDDIRALTQQVRDRVTQAQADRCDYGASLPRYRDSMAQIMDHDIGPIWDLANQIDGTLPTDGPTPPPNPDPDPPKPSGEDEDWGSFLSGAVGLVGKTKWTSTVPGMNHNGADIFVARHTRVRAPHSGRVTFEQVPGGPMLIGQLLLVYDDGRAVRLRHVQTLVGNGVQVQQGDEIAYVLDPSMDLLHWPRAYPTPPDGYQHCDVSLATSVARLDPAGGAGGDVNAYNHIWNECGGMPNITVIPHTPGPQDGMIGFSRDERLAWKPWLGQAFTAQLERGLEEGEVLEYDRHPDAHSPLPVHESDDTAPVGISRTKPLPAPVDNRVQPGPYEVPDEDDDEGLDAEGEESVATPRRKRGRPRKQP